MVEYRLISKKGEGTFSEVLKAQSIKTQKFVAIKCMKNHFDSIDQVSLKLVFFFYPLEIFSNLCVAKVNNLREIQALRRLSPHPQIIKLYEVL
jgi:renal tumor antigen